MMKLLALTCMLLFAAAESAGACPPGAVFSHFGENCHWKGRGKDEAVKCTVKQGACPAGSVTKRFARGTMGCATGSKVRCCR